MKTKNKILLAITGIMTVLLITIGLSYAYFSANLTGGEEATTITVTGGTMNIVYNGGANISVGNILPSDEAWATKTFTVTGNNTTDIEMKYQLNLVVEENTFSEEALKYKLISTNTSSHGTTAPSINTLTNIGTGAKTLSLGVGEFASPTNGNKVHTYNLELYFPSKDENQNIDQEKEIKAHIEIIEYVAPEPTLADNIIELAGNSETTGVYNENGYRYEGATPNNYVRFNNELWRIIGVFDEETHGVAGEQLVKIIRAESIGNYAWNDNDINDWNTSTLKTYLNGEYYNEIVANSKNLIKNITWHLGGYSTIVAIVAEFYTAERGTIVYSGRPTTGEGHIGLMYASDYGYASPATSCNRTTLLSDYTTTEPPCINNNWLFDTEYHQWLLTPVPYYSWCVYYVSRYGFVYGGEIPTSLGLGVRPVLYLKSNTMKQSGEGTIDNPYEIGE